jgi:hypothetical protein
MTSPQLRSIQTWSQFADLPRGEPESSLDLTAYSDIAPARSM